MESIRENIYYYHLFNTTVLRAYLVQGRLCVGICQWKETQRSLPLWNTCPSWGVVPGKWSLVLLWPGLVQSCLDRTTSLESKFSLDGLRPTPPHPTFKVQTLQNTDPWWEGEKQESLSHTQKQARPINLKIKIATYFSTWH